MSEEITKVMDEQRELEMEYARLVHQREQLKGISNKTQLTETKEEIMVRDYSTVLHIFTYRESPRSSRRARRSFAASFRKSPTSKETPLRSDPTREL
jgi:hypothetical protein